MHGTGESGMRSGLHGWVLFALMGLAGCGGGGVSSSRPGAPQPSPTAGPTATPIVAVPAVDHVILVVLENHSFSQVIGSSAMPFFNSLASRNSLAGNYFANTHPSIGNYFMLTTGNIETNDDNFGGTIGGDNLAAALTGVNKTWKAYMESLPSAGYTGGDTGLYIKHHDPMVYFDSVLGSSAQIANVVPFTQLAVDLAAASFPNFALIVPNVENDGHNCPGGASTCADSDKLAAADAWLQNNVGPLIGNSSLGNSVLIITFDEGNAADLANGGGQIATVFVGQQVKTGFVSMTLYQHQNTLRLILDLLNVSDHPGTSAQAATMGEFFQ